MSRGKKTVIVLFLVFIAMQFIQPARNKSSEQQENIMKNFNFPASVTSILKTSCYDCHSNNTCYPWYANIQPLGWLLANHIKEGKNELNFSDFNKYSVRRQISKFKAIRNSIKDGTMPLASYTWLHHNAKLSEASKALLIDWSLRAADSLSNE